MSASFDLDNLDEGFFDEDDAPQERRKKVTNLQKDDVMGFIKLLQGVATEYAPQLAAKQYDPAATSLALEGQMKTTTEAFATATASDIATQALYATADGKKQDLYTAGSNWCDVMANTLGKETPEGKAILAIRANLKSTPRKPKTPTP